MSCWGLSFDLFSWPAPLIQKPYHRTCGNLKFLSKACVYTGNQSLTPLNLYSYLNYLGLKLCTWYFVHNQDPNEWNSGFVFHLKIKASCLSRTVWLRLTCTVQEWSCELHLHYIHWHSCTFSLTKGPWCYASDGNDKYWAVRPSAVMCSWMRCCSLFQFDIAEKFITHTWNNYLFRLIHGDCSRALWWMPFYCSVEMTCNMVLLLGLPCVMSIFLCSGQLNSSIGSLYA